MKILVTGAGGNLGRRLVSEMGARNEILAKTHHELDISDLDAVRSASREFQPEIILNAAAFTAVDRCEEEIDLAYSVNAIGARNLAIAANESSATLVHYSTDFVFDGTRTDPPYREYDEVNPLSVYGKSKYSGEVEVRQIAHAFLILRVAWLYGAGGWNFSDWVVEQIGQGKRIRIVTDQFGSPTWVGDVVAQTRHLLDRGGRGLYHSVNTGSCSRYEWAIEAALIAGFDTDGIEPITSAEFPQKAPRPKYSVLDNFALRAQGLEVMRPWRNALKDHLTRP